MRLGDCAGMSTASVLLATDFGPMSGSPDRDDAAPSYTLLLSTDPTLVEEAQRLRYDVFTSEPGYQLTSTTDADRFDEFCDHLLVREDSTGELVGCYRMLPPPGAIAAGGLYTATEFDIRALDPLRSSLVEMGRAVVRADHRNGAVVLLMWAGILAYLDRSGYDYVTGCVSVPLDDVRGVREEVLRRYRSTYEVKPHRPVPLDGLPVSERPNMPPLMRAYLRLGARVCGEPAHDPDFGVADFMALLDKRRADIRYLKRLRSVAAAAEAVR
jgi:putative hemolysin